MVDVTTIETDQGNVRPRCNAMGKAPIVFDPQMRNTYYF